MRKEIHRMKLRYDQLRKKQEELIKDMERSVFKRETIQLKYLPKVEKKNAQKKEGTKLAQTTNPVWNPPFNNWSVNQPSGPHQTGLSAYQDLGQNMIVDGHRVHYWASRLNINQTKLIDK